MIAPWPIPYSDETLYSWIARYRTRVRHPSIQSLMEDLFGSPRVAASTDFAYGIDHLAARLRPCLSLSGADLVNNHTLFPFYAPFLGARQADILLEVIENGLPKRRPPFNPRRGSVKVPEFLRFCPECATEERNMYGECYWHRLHQVPGIEVCERHEVWLESTSSPARSLGAWHPFSLAQDTVPTAEGRLLSTHEPGRSVLLQLAHDAASLLQQPFFSADPSALWKRYRFVLREQGLCSFRGKVAITELLRRFHRLYPETMLARLGGTSDRLASGRGILQLARKPKGGLPPVYHLLMMQLLGKTAEQFFAIPAEANDFGSGPWPCLNPVARHYLDRVIPTHSVAIQKDGGRPVATFTCQCGFHYARVGPDWGPLAQFSYTRVDSYGSLWDRRFQRLWLSEDMTLALISKAVGIAEENLSMHAARLKLPVWRRNSGHSPVAGRKRSWRGRPSSPDVMTIQLMRAEWKRLALVSRPQDKPARQRLYHWLYRHDHTWLVRQPSGTRLPRYTRGVDRISWEARDRCLAQAIEQVATSLKLSPPGKLSMNWLIRHSGFRHLIHPNLQRLPETRRTLLQCIGAGEESPC